MKDFLDAIRKNWLYTALISIVLGLVLVIFPHITARILCYLLGGLILIFGVTRLLRYFRRDGAIPDFFRLDLMSGLFGVLIGLVIIVKADAVISLIPVIFGIALVAGGIADMQRALDYKGAGYPKWWLLLLFAVLTLALGVVLVIDPFGANSVVMVAFVGGSLIYEGIMDIITVSIIGKRIAEWKNL